MHTGCDEDSRRNMLASRCMMCLGGAITATALGPTSIYHARLNRQNPAPRDQSVNKWRCGFTKRRALQLTVTSKKLPPKKV